MKFLAQCLLQSLDIIGQIDMNVSRFSRCWADEVELDLDLLLHVNFLLEILMESLFWKGQPYSQLRSFEINRI
jgi:hypothetical protein